MRSRFTAAELAEYGYELPEREPGEDPVEEQHVNEFTEVVQEIGNRGIIAEQQAIDAAKPAPERFPVVTARELMTTKYVRIYLIHKILAQGGFCIMVAPLKTLKTSLALLMAVCLALGIPLFGMFDLPERKRVGFMSGEADCSTIQDTLTRICKPMSLRDDALEGLIFSFSVPRLDVDEDLAAVEKFIVDNRIEVLFLDCFYFMLGGFAEKASNLFAMGGLLRKLLEIQQRTGATICMLHHMPKHTACGEPALDQAAFAGISECARQWLLINRMVPFDPAATEMIHKLWFVSGGSAGHCTSLALSINEGNQDNPGGRTWSLEAEWAHEARKEMAAVEQDEKERRRVDRKETELADDRATVMEVVEALEAPNTKTGIRELCAISGERFGRAWASLLKDKALGSAQIRKGNNRAYDAFWTPAKMKDWSNGQQQSATVEPMPTDAVATERTDLPIGSPTDATMRNSQLFATVANEESDRCDSEGEPCDSF
jgi:hypothetical protein